MVDRVTLKVPVADNFVDCCWCWHLLVFRLFSEISQNFFDETCLLEILIFFYVWNVSSFLLVSSPVTANNILRNVAWSFPNVIFFLHLYHQTRYFISGPCPMCCTILSTSYSLSLDTSWSVSIVWGVGTLGVVPYPLFLLWCVDTHWSWQSCDFLSFENEECAYVATRSSCGDEEGAYATLYIHTGCRFSLLSIVIVFFLDTYYSVWSHMARLEFFARVLHYGFLRDIKTWPQCWTV